MDLKHELKNYLPEYNRESKNFASLMSQVGTLLDEIGDTIDNMKYYSDYRKMPENRIEDYSNMFGISFPRNLSSETKRLFVRDIFNIHQTNGTEKTIKFLFKVVGLNIEIDYIWAINPTTDKYLAYQSNNPFTYTDNISYNNDLSIGQIIDVSRVDEYSSGNFSWTNATNVPSIEITSNDAFFEYFGSSLFHWNVSPNFITKTGSQLSLTSLVDGTIGQYGLESKQSLKGYDRVSIEFDFSTFQTDFGAIVGENYIKMYLDSNNVQHIKLLRKEFPTTNTYNVELQHYTISNANQLSGYALPGGAYPGYAIPGISSTVQPFFSPHWRFEVNSDKTIDFYMGGSIVFSNFSRKGDTVGIWFDGKANRQLTFNRFAMTYSPTDYVWETLSGQQSKSVSTFQKGDSLVNKSLMIRYNLSGLTSGNVTTSANLFGSGMEYSDGNYVSLIDATDVSYDRLEILNENYPIAHRTTTNKALKTPYIRITVTKKDYNLLTADYTDPETGVIYSFTDTERYKITQEVINYFMGQGRPANVVVTEISTPFSLDDVISYLPSDSGFSVTYHDNGWVFDGTVNLDMDTDRYVLGETFTGFNFGNSNLTLETNPPTVTVNRSYPIGTVGLQPYIATRKNASITLTVPYDAKVNIYSSTNNRVELAKGNYKTQLISTESSVTNKVISVNNVFAVMINIITPSKVGSIDFSVTEL